jgi:hypothetical protein
VTPADDATLRARALLASVRATPLLRGHPTAAQRERQDGIAGVVAACGVLGRLARRVASQLVQKCDAAALGGPATWHAIGRQLAAETDSLRARLALVDRQIIVALPKLAPEAIEHLHDSLKRREPAVARTILNAALDAQVPAEMAERYLEQFRQVVASLSHLEPAVARSMANATFMARRPRETARQHLERFDDLVRGFRPKGAPARTLAREAYRAKRPRVAGERFLAHRRAVIAFLESRGTDASVARTLAGIACLSADPMAKAGQLLAQFDAVLRLALVTHPSVARSIALSACRSSDALGAARRYMANYDLIVQEIGRTDPGRAHMTAAQAFRSDQPLRWARRFLGAPKTGTKKG